jgi:putative membrane protein
MRSRMTYGTAAAIMFSVGACSRTAVETASSPTPASPAATTTAASTDTGATAASSARSMSSAGDVKLTAGGMWVTDSGGMWMDSSGGLWTGEHGQPLDLQPSNMSAMTNANVAAHLSAGDSLEISLSRLGMEHSRNAEVRAFADRMVTEHTSHMQMANQKVTASGVTPVPSPADTVDAGMAQRMMQRLSTRVDSADYDRELMGDEVMMHRHMLHDLMTVRGQASGAVLTLIEQTIPVVRQHLSDAEGIRTRLGSGSGSR